MAVKPILFSGPMVRAILDGRKSMTRRILRPRKGLTIGDLERDGEREALPLGTAYRATRDQVAEPRFAPGDLLWVRETWAQFHPAGIQPGRFSIEGRAGIPGPPGITYRVIYRADGDPVRVWHCADYPYRTPDGPADELAAKHPSVCSEFPGWDSPIYMPREFSRLTLEVTAVKVERLQDITEADARAEGCPVSWDQKPYDPPPPEVDSWQGYGRASFCLLWNQINGPGAWEANPWVAAVSFTVHRANVDALPAKAA